jgi:hypothetical protein
MNGEHLDVLMIAAPVYVLVLDSNVRKMDLVIEVRQVMVGRPRANLVLGSIRMPVVVVALAVVLMKPLLIVALQLVVEDDAIDAGALLFQALRGVQIRVIDLRIVFELARSFEACVVGLAATLGGIAMSLQQLTAPLREDHRMVAVTRNPNRLDQPLLAKISQVAGSRIGRTARVITQPTGWHNPERADG